MDKKSIPFESPISIIGSQAADISGLLQLQPVFKDCHQPGHASFYVGFVKDGSSGQIIVRDGIVFIGNDQGDGAYIGCFFRYPFICQPAAYHTFPGRM